MAKKERTITIVMEATDEQRDQVVQIISDALEKYGISYTAERSGE